MRVLIFDTDTYNRYLGPKVSETNRIEFWKTTGWSEPQLIHDPSLIKKDTVKIERKDFWPEKVNPILQKKEIKRRKPSER